MNTTTKGDLFEERAFQIISVAIQEEQLGLIPGNCRIFRKKAYFSKERQSNIIFDLSIEVWLPDADQYHLLYLIECKDYSRPVPVNDVEEFVSHINQVTGVNAKGIFITTQKLQQGALEYARSKGLMLIEVSKENIQKIILHNRNKKNSHLTDEPVISWPTQINRLSEISMVYDEQDTSPSDWDSIIQNLLNKQLNANYYWEQPGTEVIGLERLSFQLIEELTIDIINDFNPSILRNYEAFPIHDFISYFQEKFGTTVITDQNIPLIKGKKLNGYCDFENKKVFIDVDLVDTGQFAFVCAHEIGHYFLHSHLQISQAEYDKQPDSKYDPAIGKYALLNEKHWIEWQANQFAASLIMPKRSVLGKLLEWQYKVGIRNKGSVFLDKQPCNIRDFKVVITLLAFEFKVSRTILEYRMRELKIIKYANEKGYGSSLFGYIRQAQSLSQIMSKMFS